MGSFSLVNYPAVLFIVSVIGLWGFAQLGAFLRRQNLEGGRKEDFGLIQGAALTLLALIIGFSFSLASGRYDQRKGLEEAEANAIGTEYVRAGLLPSADAARTEALLKSYLNERILFYDPVDDSRIPQIDDDTAKLQTELWNAVQAPTIAKPTPVNALVASGMNDVLNSQSYTQAAWWNRIPSSAWWLMALIAICANGLVGFGSHPGKGRAFMLVIVPVFASVAFMLIADLDSPRGGLIHVTPQNLLSLAASFKSP